MERKEYTITLYKHEVIELITSLEVEAAFFDQLPNSYFPEDSVYWKMKRVYRIIKDYEKGGEEI